MVIALFALLVLFTLGLSFLTLSGSSLTTSKREVMRARALEVAEAGAQKAIAYLRHTAPDGTIDGSWRTVHLASDPDDHSQDSWRVETLNSSETYKLCVRSGVGINTGKIIITSVGTVTYGSSTCSRTVKVIVLREEENINVWNNVIFGGVGQAGKSINGNVVMRGSVHLLGDGEDFTDVDTDGRWDSGESYTDQNGNGQYDSGEPYTDIDGDGHRDGLEPWDDVNGNGIRDPALTVTDMASEVAGDANAGNNYTGMTAFLEGRLPPLPTTWFNSEQVRTLSAKIRVKHGKVNISGSAKVGSPDVPGGTPAIKETMNGCYVSDGWGGNAGAASVYSDNGSSAGYDLGEGVISFPALTDPYTDGGGVSYPTYMDYLQANATVVAGPLDLAPDTTLDVSGPNGSLSLDGSGNMTISGIVYVTGDINFNRSGGTRLTYSGSGTLVSTGSAFVHCDLVPETNFPLGEVLGVICRRRMELATGAGDAQLTMAGAFYAQEKVISQKQSEIAGSLVSSYYQMQNVPHLYQVPELVNHLPPGMPGSRSVWVISVTVQSWKEM